MDRNGGYILLDNGDYFFSTQAKLDEYGAYLPIPAMSKPGQKLFICICNDMEELSPGDVQEKNLKAQTFELFLMDGRI